MTRPNAKSKYKFITLTDEEIKRLIDSAETFMDRVLLELAITTGIRRQDIAGIQLSDVDLKSRTVTFWQEKKDNTHNVPITLTLLPEITRYINSLPKGSRWLFPSDRKKGAHMSDRAFWDRLQKHLVRAGIKKTLRFHDLRATCAKYWERRGLSASTVADLMDDKLETVKEYYNVKDVDEIRQEMDKATKGD